MCETISIVNHLRLNFRAATAARRGARSANQLHVVYSESIKTPNACLTVQQLVCLGVFYEVSGGFLAELNSLPLSREVRSFGADDSLMGFVSALLDRISD